MQPSLPTIDYSRKWYVLSAVSMGIFLATIDGSIVNVAMPTLVRDLNTNFSTVQWVVLSYMLTLATLLLGVGRLGDMIGKKQIYNSGFVIFTLGSVLCGLAPDIYWLIAFRVVQAVGGAMVFGLGMAIVTEAFPPYERGKALGITGTVVSVGIVLGPTVGGLILAVASWHWIFLVNLPVGILGTLMVWRFVPSFKPVGGQKFDFAGAVTMFISLSSLLLFLTLGQQVGFTDSRMLFLLVTWLVFLLIFIAIEWRSAHPMLDLHLFENNLFRYGLMTGFITFMAIAGVTVVMPFYLENVLGYSIEGVGLMLAVIPVVLGVVAPISGVLSDRFGSRLITVIGLGILVGGYAAASTLGAATTTLGYILRMAPVGLGMGIFQSPNNSAIMGAVPRQRLGVASGLLSMTRTLGQTTGIAIAGAVWATLVALSYGEALPGGATSAPIEAQVVGLQQTFMGIAGLVFIALLLSLWGWAAEKREQAG